MSTTAASADSTRSRLLEASSVVLAQYGPRKLSLTDIAAFAGVSRPTLYRHFASKDELLRALSAHEKERFERELAAALGGLDGRVRLDRALEFVVEFQQDYPMRRLVVTEAAFILEQLEQALRTMADSLVPLIKDLSPAAASRSARPDDLADLVVRTALSHFLIPGDDAQLLRELRHVVGLDG